MDTTDLPNLLAAHGALPKRTPKAFIILMHLLGVLGQRQAAAIDEIAQAREALQGANGVSLSHARN